MDDFENFENSYLDLEARYQKATSYNPSSHFKQQKGPEVGFPNIEIIFLKNFRKFYGIEGKPK